MTSHEENDDIGSCDDRVSSSEIDRHDDDDDGQSLPKCPQKIQSASSRKALTTSERNAERAARTLAEDFGDMAIVDNGSPAQDVLPPTLASMTSSTAVPRRAAQGDSPSSAIPSFTSDSPYLQSYIDREMRNLIVLTDTLRDISARARTFGKCGALMAEATRRLSSACRLNPPTTGASGNSGTSGAGGGLRKSDSGEDMTVGYDEQMRVMQERKESVGDEMASVLSVLGEVSTMLGKLTQRCFHLSRKVFFTPHFLHNTYLHCFRYLMR